MLPSVHFMEEITFFDEPPETVPNKQFFNQKRRLLFIYIPIFASVGFLAALGFEDSKGTSRLIDLLLTLGLNYAAYVWIRIDSEESGYELHYVFAFAVIILGLLALLYYLFRSRGFRGGLISTGWFLLYAATCFVATIILSLVISIALVLVGILPPEVFDE